MNWFKRYSLFFLVNILVVLTISLTTSLLGLNRYLEANGINYQALLVFCLVWGMAGSLISLMMSRFMVKRMMNVVVLDPNDRFQTHANLINLVHRLARQSGIQKMPEVGIYEANELNAFATGPTKNRALVAVSSGLLTRMNDQELEGVLAHEVAHVANGDMVTMTLLQGVINAFVMFLARVLAHAIATMTRSSSDNRGVNYGLVMILTFVFELILSVLGFIVVCAFSRHREFRADAGGAKLAGREKMKAALEKLRVTYQDDKKDQPAIAAFKISSKSGKSLARLFSTHPPLDERIKALELSNYR